MSGRSMKGTRVHGGDSTSHSTTAAIDHTACELRNQPERNGDLMSQQYDVFLARGREIVGGPVGSAVTRDTGDIAVETGVYPVGPNFHLVLRPVPAEAAA